MHTEAFVEKEHRLKETVRPRGLYVILTKSDKFWKSAKTKERGLGFKGWYIVGTWIQG